MTGADTRYSVLTAGQQPLDVARFGPLLGEVLGLHRIDANRRARRQRGILASDLDGATATRLVEALAGYDVPAEAVDQAFLERPPRGRTTFYLDSWADGVIVGSDGDSEIPWSRVRLLAVSALLPEQFTSDDESLVAGVEAGLAAGLTPEERHLLRSRNAERATRPQPLADLPEWLATVDHDGMERIATDLPRFVLDLIFTDPDERIRVNGPELLPTPLGDERTPNWLRNLWVTARRLAEHLPAGAVTPGTWAFLHQRPDWSLVFDLDMEVEQSLTWQLHHRHRAELEALVAEDVLDESDADADGR